MRFSKPELKMLEKVAHGQNEVFEIAKALNKDKSQVYRLVQNLDKKGFARLEDGKVRPFSHLHVQLLLQELNRRPSFIDSLSGCGLTLFTYILEPRTVQEIVEATGIKKSTVFYKLKKAQRHNFIRKQDSKYQFNAKLWPRMKEFLSELQQYEETVDSRIPAGSIIYHKTDKEIVFSTKAEFDAALTGFSMYEHYGIRIFPVDYTYYLPKKRLNKNEVFLHSLYRVEKEPTKQNLLLIALFYAKHKKTLSVEHEILRNIEQVLQRKVIKGYPQYSEVRERAVMYDIKI